MNKKYVIIDGNYLLYRSFWGIRELYGPNNEPVNAVYGFFSTLLKLLDWTLADGLVLAFDMGKPQFRSEKIPDYKANREKMPDELRSQLGLIQNIAEQSNMLVYKYPEYEADDIIATVSRSIESEGDQSMIFSADMDLFQLLSPKTSIVRTDKLRNYYLYTPEEFEKQWNITPKQILDYKALRGDSSDQIPGIPGVGEKTAIKLICEYGSLDAIYEHVGEIKGALQNKLVDNKELAYISRDVATLIENAPIDFKSDASYLHHIDFDILEKQFESYSFYTLLKRLQRFLEKRGMREKKQKEKKSKSVKPQNDDTQMTLFS